MKSMKSAKDYYTPPPKGRHPAIVSLAEATFSKKGASMIHIAVTLEGQYAGEQLEDWCITDGTAKGAGIGKAKLRGLGVDVETDAEIPDETIAQSLLGRRVFVEVDHEPSMRKDEAGNLVPSTHFDSSTGQTIALQRAIAKGYSPVNVGVATAPVQQAPQQFAAPQGFQPQMQAPQQFQPQMQAPQQFQQGFQPQMQAPQQFAAPQQFQQGFQPQMQAPQGQVPQQFAPPLPQAQAPWAGQQVTPAAAAEAEPKKKRKMNVQDAAAEN